MKKISSVFLAVVLFVVLPLAGARPLRIPGVYQSVGVVLFALMAAAVWLLLRGGARDARTALSGVLLVAPFALVALLWIGLGTPWDATPRENVMRYSVLLAASIAVTLAFVLLRDALRDAGELLHSALGFGASLLAGAAYVVWMCFELGAHALKATQGKVPDSIAAMGQVFDTLLFAACALTYVSVAAFALALGRAGWLGRTAARTYVAINLIALTFLTLRGLSFPDPAAGATPWYTRPGFIAGIPAIPWVMPYLLGVVLLRRG